MARPKAKELTERELEVMHVFWDRGESTAAEVRDVLETQGRELAYTTVATLVKILHDKQFLTQTSDERPFKFQPARTYEEVSSSLLGDLVQKVFGGSRANLLVRLFEEEKLSADEKKRLKQILDEGGRK
jgi:BlaI family transcriptional regulator, penicillinase repressor